MPTHYEISKALNQLASVLVGRERAIETNELERDPFARIEKLKLLVDEDFKQANAVGDQKILKQVERTMISLSSLMVLAEAAERVVERP